MLFEEGLHEHLRRDLTLAPLVSTRIYPLVLPQDPTMPAITYGRTGGARQRTLSGPSHIEEPEFAVTAWADTYTQAKHVAHKIVASLDGLSGALGGVEVLECWFVNEADDYDSTVQSYGCESTFRALAHQDDPVRGRAQ